MDPNGCLLVVLLFTAFQVTVNFSPPNYSTDLETQLRTELYDGYEVLQRPGELVPVAITLNLLTVNSLDIKAQTLSTTGYFTMAWTDSRLSWSSNSNYTNIRNLFSSETYTWRPTVIIENSFWLSGSLNDYTSRTFQIVRHVTHRLKCFPVVYRETKFWTDSRLRWNLLSNYRNIRFIFSSETYTWRPAIIIENSVSELEVFSDTNTLIRVTSLGLCVWSPGGIFETYCEADVTYYPLDVQTCTIILSTWAYTSGEVSLKFGTPEIRMDHLKENGEWELIETSTVSETSTRESESYSRLYFTLKLKRRPLFHILNTLFPVILLAALIIFVFKLPPESGERVGMSLTVLLAYAVYLTLISDNIPQTSLSASILSTYLTIILMLSALSVVFTILVLDIYFNHEDDEEMPAWLQKLTRQFLVKVAMWKGNKCCKRKDHKVTPEEETMTMVSTTELGMSYPLNHKSNGDVSYNTKHKLDRENSEVTQSTSSMSSGDESEKVYSWKEVALILDRCFMYIFIFLVLSCTVICLVILCSQFSNS